MEHDHDPFDEAFFGRGTLQAPRPITARPVLPSVWWADWGNITELGHYLLDVHGFGADDLQRYYEKPHKWDNEWNEMLAAKANRTHVLNK